MKEILQVIALAAILAYLAKVRISFAPFSISFDRGWFVIGMILIAIGASIIYYQGRWDGLRRGVEIKEEVKKEIIEESKIKNSL